MSEQSTCLQEVIKLSKGVNTSYFQTYSNLKSSEFGNTTRFRAHLRPNQTKNTECKGFNKHLLYDRRANQILNTLF